MTTATGARLLLPRFLRSSAAGLLVAAALAGAVPPTVPAAQAASLFALVDTGELFKSTNHGVTWSAVSTLPVRDAVALAAGSTTSDLYLASGSGVVYRSTNAGVSWMATGAMNASDAVELLVQPDLSVLVLTARGTLYRSADEGANFSARGALAGSDFVSLAYVTPTVKLYAMTRTGSIFESGDGGANWTASGAITVSDGVELRAVGTTLYALSATGDTYRSVDSGVNWTAVGTLSQSGMTGLTRDGATLVASTNAGDVATSPDGAAWVWKGIINQVTVTALANDSPATTGVTLSGGPPRLEVSPPWPNPARAGDGVTLRLTLPRDEMVTFEVYDIAGRRSWTQGPEPFSAGERTVEITIRELRAGLHLVRIDAGTSGRSTRRVAVVE